LRRETTWKIQWAEVWSIGRYPSSSTTRTEGPVNVRIFALEFPSRWALCSEATRSEAVVKYVR
jgi:hypothetical protein